METYWHWLADDRRLQWGTKEAVEVGKTLAVEFPYANPMDGVTYEKVTLCKAGFHASKKPLDALQYAPGAVICCVTLGGTVIEGPDKVVAGERTVLWMADATNTLHEFACWCAEDALRTAKVEDVRFWNAIETKRKWLRGEATDAELAAAWDAAGDAASAARAAAWAAAWAAARAAARAAAGDAARAAASAAAWDAAGDAATAAAWAAARDAAREKQNARLTEMLMELKRQD